MDNTIEDKIIQSNTFDEISKSTFIEYNFDSASPEERQAHTLRVMHALMEVIVGNPVKFIDIGVKAGLIDKPEEN